VPLPLATTVKVPELPDASDSDEGWVVMLGTETELEELELDESELPPPPQPGSTEHPMDSTKTRAR